MSVAFCEKNSEATCKVCLQLATDGTLDKLEKQRHEKMEVKGQTGANHTGAPRYTEMQKAFAGHPLITQNPVKAAIEVGYSPKTARKHAHKMREQLAPLIMENQEIAARRSAISKSRVQSELAAMGFANVIDYFETLPNGAMIPVKISDLTREQTAAIQDVEVGPFLNPMTGEEEFRITKLKLSDKRASLVELGKTLGMFNKFTIEDKREETLALNEIPTESLEEAESILLAAVRKSREQRGKNEAIEGEYTAIEGPAAE